MEFDEGIEKVDEALRCAHKWVHLRDMGPVEIGYRRWGRRDLFFCERCLEQRTIEYEQPETRSFGAW